MRVQAQIKLKNGPIMEALEQRGWTQAELARQTGLRQTEVGLVCNLKFGKVSWKTIETIALELDLETHKVCPPKLKQLHFPNTLVITKDIPEDELLEASRDDLQTRFIVHAPHETQAILKDDLEAAMATLRPNNQTHARWRLVLELKYLKGWTQAAIARDLGVTQETVRQTLDKAIEYIRGKLRLPRWIPEGRSFLDEGPAA